MKKKKIKILHVAQAAGGVDRYIRMLLKYLDKEKFENILVCSQDFREKDYKNLVDFFEQVKMDRAIGSNDLKAIGEVRRLIKRYNPDIVYRILIDLRERSKRLLNGCYVLELSVGALFVIQRKGDWIIWKKYLQLLQFINQKNFCRN